MIHLACNAMMRDPDDSDQWLPIEILIDQVQELGFDAIDFQLDRGFGSTDPEYLEAIRKDCEKRSLPIGAIGIGGGFVGSVTNQEGNPIGIALTKDERTRRIQEAQHAIDAAAILGAPMIRMFGGGIPEATENRAGLWLQKIEAFKEICDHAGSAGVYVGLHNHPPAVPPTGDDILQILADVDHDHLTHILDTGQWYGSPGTNRERKSIPGVDFYGFMEQTVSHATYVRTKIYKIDSGVEEWLDYPRIAKIILDAGYDGVISLVFEDRNNTCDYVECWRLGAAHLRACFGLSS